MTTRFATALMTLGAALVAATASAQVTVTHVRPASIRPPQPVVSAPQRKLPATTIRPTMTKPASDTYRAASRATTNDLAQQQRPSLGALANASRARATHLQTPPITVAPPVRIQPRPQR